MNILLVSQCHKNALKETRRILDQFAERCGDRTWQTAITKAGLDTLHKLLRQTARKNTAIACYWTHGKNLTALLWIVGDKQQFNDQGRIPTNRTKRNILKAEDENTWQYGTSIQILAVLGALLHDLGKATKGFQQKLKPSHQLIADPYRHEWISLQLFILMLKDCQTNEECLQRLADFKTYRTKNPSWYSALIEVTAIDLSTLPPIAQFIGWLIVTHHRLHFTAHPQSDTHKPYAQKLNKKDAQSNTDYTQNYLLDDFYRYEIKATHYWVVNPNSTHKKTQDFWELRADISQSDAWQKQLTRWANKALNHPVLMNSSQNTISHPHFFYLARLALMVGDHNYSSLPTEATQRVKGEKNFPLIANTDKNTRQPKQTLDEHLIGVAKLTARFARLLPKLSKELPALQKNKLFSQRSKIKRFHWQNTAFDLAKKIQPLAEQQGFFGINMASTGCGKTLGNARIMYALGNSQRGARFTIALGLRVLTLQTGQALQQKLALNDEQLVTLVGGQASRKLFELNLEEQQNNPENTGSESFNEIVEGIIPNLDNGISFDELGTVIANPKARSLLYTPIVSCTIDHLMAASENKRGGKHIAPLLRLLTADLILDEPDDFNQQDLPALARLVYLTGLLGSKILLSSATLTPDFVTGLFNAYQAGRTHWQQQNNLPNKGIVCAWFDEFNQQHNICTEQQTFSQTHHLFIEKRVQQLIKVPTQRIATVLPISSIQHVNNQVDYSALAKQLLAQACALHQQHHTTYADKNISIGLIRIANTTHLIPTTQAMLEQSPLPENTQVHLCCYHARQLLILRSALENKLDRLLNRTNPNQLINQPEIIQAIKTNSAKHHIFIIAATPVAEIGRDHDYDWAIIEPSSMRSIIQLAGRIARHRPEKIATLPNIAIMHSNINALKQGNSLGIGSVCFKKPGFEDNTPPDLLLDSHKINELITPEQLAVINAIARIQKKPTLQSTKYLADLEHKAMEHLFNPLQPNYITAYWQPELAHPATSHLQTISPFRDQERPQENYVCQLNMDPENNGGFNFRLETKAWENPFQIDINTQNRYIVYQPQNQIRKQDSQIQPWLVPNIEETLNQLANKLNHLDPQLTALKFATVSLQTLTDGKYWHFHPWLGFWY